MYKYITITMLLIVIVVSSMGCRMGTGSVLKDWNAEFRPQDLWNGDPRKEAEYAGNSDVYENQQKEAEKVFKDR